MLILIDTNIMLDVLMVRHPFYEESKKIFNFLAKEGRGYFTANQTTDIFYLFNKVVKDKKKTKDVLNSVTELFVVLDILGEDVKNALASPMTDYEDALLAHCAARSGMDYIVTRNAKDFAASPLLALTPAEFLELCHG